MRFRDLGILGAISGYYKYCKYIYIYIFIFIIPLGRCHPDSRIPGGCSPRTLCTLGVAPPKSCILASCAPRTPRLGGRTGGQGSFRSLSPLFLSLLSPLSLACSLPFSLPSSVPPSSFSPSSLSPLALSAASLPRSSPPRSLGATLSKYSRCCQKTIECVCEDAGKHFVLNG